MMVYNTEKCTNGRSSCCCALVQIMVNMAAVCGVAEIYGRERRLVCVFTETLNKKRSFLKLAFSSDQELEDWVCKPLLLVY